MKTLDDFCNKHPPNRRVSKLKQFQNEILELYDKDYQVEQIQEWLKTKGISVSVDAINKFKRNLKSKNSFLQNPSGAGKNETQVVSEESVDTTHHKATDNFFSNLKKYKNER